jgi:cytochrome c oxidase subunit 2
LLKVALRQKRRRQRAKSSSVFLESFVTTPKRADMVFFEAPPVECPRRRERHMLEQRKSIVLAFIASVALAWGIAAAHPTIDIAASNWKFTPSTITIKVGEPQVLRLTSSEGVHGLQSDDLGIPLTTIVPGKFVEVTATAKKPGTYVLHCAIMCGAGHPNMTLTVIAQP